MIKNTKVNAAILIIGNEILSGRTQDTNTSTLATWLNSVSYTHLRAHETKANLVCRLLLEKMDNFQFQHLDYHFEL